MKLLLDTNVLIAAFVARGLCHELVEHSQREHHLVSSEHLLTEFQSKLERKFRVPPEQAVAALSLIREQLEIVVPEPLPSPVCREPDDDWVLATARSGKCEYIVTGDRNLLDLTSFQEIGILEPRASWTLEASRPPRS